MMLVGARGQQVRDLTFDASGVITNGGTPQLVLPQGVQRSMLLLQNLSAKSLWFELGGARAAATLTSGAVSSIAITNAGFGYTIAPYVEFLGGGNAGNSTNLSSGQYGYQAPSRPARGTAVLGTGGSAGTIVSITIDDPGAGYVCAPYVQIINSLNDPNGAADPSTSSGVGILLAAAGGSIYINGTVCTVDAVSVFGTDTNQRFTAKWAP